MENDAAQQSSLAADVEITGTIKTAGSIRIDGKLDGELSCGGDTVVGKGATIKGNINVNSVTIAGTITGNITARDRIEMKASARVTGDIKAKRLAVEDGVTFIGKSEVNPSGSPAAASVPPSAATRVEIPPSESKTGFFGKK